MTSPNVDPTPSPIQNTLERLSPYEFLVRKTIGNEVASRLFHVRPIPEMEQTDLEEMYDCAISDNEGNPIPVVFISKSATNKDMSASLEKTKDGTFIARKVDNDGGGSGMTYGSIDALWDIHRYFTLDFEYGDRERSQMFMGYGEDGEPEIIEIGEVGPEDLFDE